MEKDLLIYKLEKYKTKLSQNPNNNIYQQKVNQYINLLMGENLDLYISKK